MDLKKINGFVRNAYTYKYEEKETETEIIITSKAVFKKDSKTAMNFLEKSKSKGILPLCKILKSLKEDIKKE